MKPGDEVVMEGGDPQNQIPPEENPTPAGPANPQPQCAPAKAVKKTIEDPQDGQEFETI